MLLVLLFSLFFNLCFASTTNYLRITKNDKDPLAFNIKVGGVKYFENDQKVLDMGTVYTFPFERRYEDTVAVVFSEYSDYPGLFVIDSHENNTYFDSSSQEFYIINQCSMPVCDLKIEEFGNWEWYRAGRNTAKSSASIYINGEDKRIRIADGSHTIKIKKDDVIKIETVPVIYPIGLTFTTTVKGISQGAPIDWFNSNLATQMLIPSYYFSSPLNGVTLFEGTKAPIELVSYPEDRNIEVHLHCNGEFIEKKSIKSNGEKTKTAFMIPNRRDGQICKFTNGGLNSVYFTISSQTPKSITFAAPKSGSTFTAGTFASIKLITQPESLANFTVKLSCDSMSMTRLIRSNELDELFFIPDNFNGNNCKFDVMYPKKATKSPSIKIIKPSISITMPQPNTRIPAGSNTPILISTDTDIPDGPEVVVQLDCGRGMTKRMKIKPKAMQDFLVPFEFSIGSACTLSIVEYPSYYNAPAAVIVIVTPPINEITTQSTSVSLTSNTNYVTTTTSSSTTTTTTITLSRNDYITTATTGDTSYATTQTYTGNLITSDTFTQTTRDSSTQTSTSTSTSTATTTTTDPTASASTVTMTSASIYTSTLTSTLTTTTTDTTTLYVTMTSTDTQTSTVTMTTTDTATQTSTSTVISTTTTPTLTIAFAPINETTYYPGNSVPIKLVTNRKTSEYTCAVRLTCGYLSITRDICANMDGQEFLIPEEFSGKECEFDVVDPQSADNSLMITVLELPVLTIKIPKSVMFGWPVPVRVDTSGPTPLLYDLKFSCHYGKHEWERLTTGRTYEIVPPGIYGQVDVIATAKDAVPAKATLTIVRIANNNPPEYKPSRLPQAKKDKEREDGNEREEGKEDED